MARATVLFSVLGTSAAFRGPALAHTRRAVVSASTTFSVEEAIKAKDVVVFSKSFCPFCAKTKSLFKSLEVDADIHELDQRDDGPDIQAELKELTGQSTVPNVFIKGQHLGGNDDTQKAHSSGKLAEMLA
ncbi:hypothetical protein CTAYLR_005993 [Chrysophaeum taylorii]|uniref:Glutaredoxin domain-containing protein n=1 Tax=Chrysophaeum taylorii TaxID=2483200 RepID=A0AAD7XH88_9STRA|nr:hypothetical protein CTAYLR_005993 [Chrysophaeum taylorii]